MEERKKPALRGRIIGAVLSICILIGFSAGMLSFYPQIFEEAKKEARLEKPENTQPGQIAGAEDIPPGQPGQTELSAEPEEIQSEQIYVYRFNVRRIGDTDYNYWILYDVAMENICFICLVFAGLLLLAGLLLPCVKPLGLTYGWLYNLPLGVIVTAVAIAAACAVEEMPELLLTTMPEIEAAEIQINGTAVFMRYMDKEAERVLLYALNGIVWFLLFLVFYVGVLGVRQIFTKGLWRFLKENTLCGIILCFLVRCCKKCVASLQKIDFHEKGNTVILKIVFANFLLVTLLCCTWFVGIFGAVIYSVAVFALLSKFWGKTKREYQVLLQTTSQMADGVTNVVYDVEDGIFGDLRKELQKVQSGFNKAVQEEVKSQNMKSELITNVSHDLKTPLTAIITYVDLLKDEETSEEERKNYIRILDQKSARLKTLIEDLFEVSKANAGNIVLEPVELDLVELLKGVRVELEDKILQSGIEFRLEAPKERVMVFLDTQKTYRIFENLMLNIVKYGMPGSRAYIEIIPRGEVVCVTLKNVSAMELNFDAEAITERFVRGDTSRNSEGSGLGLAIARSFTEAQGGTLEIQTDGDLFKAVLTFSIYRRKKECDTEQCEGKMEVK